jgi:imidazolonepropionase-like amidohydrolase
LNVIAEDDMVINYGDRHRRAGTVKTIRHSNPIRLPQERQDRGKVGRRQLIGRIAILICLDVSMPWAFARPASSLAAAQSGHIVIAVSSLLDGRGRVLHDTRIVIDGSRIVGLDPHATPIDYDLRGLTTLPGWIDAHAHLASSFGEDGKFGSPPAGYQAASNAWETLMAGFTTVQSVGSPSDIPLRDAIANGSLPGPRILTSGEPLTGRGDATGAPDALRAFVRQQKAAGVDLIKILANYSVRSPQVLLSQDQLDAVCGEAKKLGLRTLVHAYQDAVRAATLAGCTQIEHGVLATDDDLNLMASRGTYLDPQAGLVWENYLLNKDRFVGTPGYPPTLDGFRSMEQLLPIYHDFFRRASKIPGLKIVFGTDALAGSHGRNAEEFIDRVRDAGADPMATMMAAHSLGAEALGMSDRIGSIASGMEADIIALNGDPLTDISAVRRVVFVMKGGIVYKNGPHH